VAEEVRDLLATLLREELRDPEIGFLTITEVDLSPDLRHARVFISTLDEAEKRDRTLDALRRAAPFLRRGLARRGGLRFIPALDFVFDASLESGARIEKLLGEILEDDNG
jgi:ribosome-binding factor A